MYYPYDSDKATIPDKLDVNLCKYDIGEDIAGTISYKVDRKDAKEIVLCITKFSCKPQVRMKPNYEE